MLCKKSEKFRPISEPCTHPKPPKSAPAPPGRGGGRLVAQTAETWGQPIHPSLYPQGGQNTHPGYFAHQAIACTPSPPFAWPPGPGITNELEAESSTAPCRTRERGGGAGRDLLSDGGRGGVNFKTHPTGGGATTKGPDATTPQLSVKTRGGGGDWGGSHTRTRPGRPPGTHPPKIRENPRT